MIRRRRPLPKWSQRELRKNVLACVTSDADEWYVRAALIFHQDLDRLPRQTEAEMRAEVEARGDVWQGPATHVVFYFDFEEDDRVACFMEGVLSELVRGWEQAQNEQHARVLAEKWVSEDGHSLGAWVPFPNMPGIYATAFFSLIQGREAEIQPRDFMWALPPDGEMTIVRQYPPKVGTEEDGQFSLMPTVVVQEMMRDLPQR